jgi:hypothetical protein
MTDILLSPCEQSLSTTAADQPQNLQSPHQESCFVDATSVIDPALDTTVEVVVQPRPMDIFCGRGKFVRHPGNKRFQSIIERHRTAYQETNEREEKSSITSQVIQDLQTNLEPGTNSYHNHENSSDEQVSREPVRFLLKAVQQDHGDCWHVVSQTYIKEKISHALRSRPKAMRKRQAIDTEEKMTRHNICQKQTLTGIEAEVHSVLQEQQALLKKLIHEQVLLEQGESPASSINAVGVNNSMHESILPAAVFITAETTMNWRTCPMEKGLHMCQHLG